MDHSGDIGVDHFHRHREGVALMKRMGLKAHRFLISWSRFFWEAKPDESRWI